METEEHKKVLFISLTHVGKPCWTAQTVNTLNALVMPNCVPHALWIPCLVLFMGRVMGQTQGYRQHQTTCVWKSFEGMCDGLANCLFLCSFCPLRSAKGIQSCLTTPVGVARSTLITTDCSSQLLSSSLWWPSSWLTLFLMVWIYCAPSSGFYAN